MSKDGAIQEIKPRRTIGGWLRRVGTILREYPPYILLIVGILLYVLVLIAQALRSDAPSPHNWTVPVQADKVELRIAYPEKLYQDGPNKMQALSAWLTYTDTAPAPTPYVVTFEPITGGVAFVNQAGLPIAPQLTLTPTLKTATPAIVYVQKASLVKSDASPAQITARLFDANGRALIQDGIKLDIHLETKWGAFWRHLGERIFSPTTPALTLAVGLVGLAIQELRQAEEHRAKAQKEAKEIAERRLEAERKRLEQKRQERYQTRVAEIEQIPLHIPNHLYKALTLYNQYKQLAETSPEWKKPEIAESLNAVWAIIKQHDWQSAALTEAAIQLQAGEFVIASERVELVLKLDPQNQKAQDLKLTIGLARTYL